MNVQVKRLTFRWDRTACILWAAVTLADGTSHAVGLPLAQVAMIYDQSFADVGVRDAFIGADDSVDGLFSSIKNAVKKVTPKVVQKAVSKAAGVVKTVVNAHVAVVRSKVTGYALTGLAAAMPAVGAPALGAYVAANRALNAYEDARAAATQVKAGIKTAANVAKVVKGGNVLQAARQLATSNHPQARMAVAALRSVKV